RPFEGAGPMRARAVQSAELLGHRLEGVRPLVARRNLLPAGIATFRHCAQGLGRKRAGGLEIDCRIGPDSIFAGTSAQPIAHSKAASAGWLQDQIVSW